MKIESEVVQSCLTLSDPMDCSPPGFSVHGIFQARVLEWGAIAFSAPDVFNIREGCVLQSPGLLLPRDIGTRSSSCLELSSADSVCGCFSALIRLLFSEEALTTLSKKVIQTSRLAPTHFPKLCFLFFLFKAI